MKLTIPDAVLDKALEEHRAHWEETARENGWPKVPPFVQIWFNPDGTVWTSVSHGGLTGDILLVLDEPMND